MPTKMVELIGLITDQLERDAEADLQTLIAPLSAAELARIIEALPGEARIPLWRQITVSLTGEVLLALHGDIRRALIGETDEAELIVSLSAMQMDELADLNEDLPISVVNAMVQAMDSQRRQRYRQVSQYPDDSAGGLMDVDATAVRADVTLKAVLRFLRRIRRREGELPEHLDSLMVVDRNNRYLGTLPLSQLVSHDADTSVAEVMVEGVQAITPLTPAAEVARRFEDEDLLSAPVVDERGYLLGRITVDDVIDVLRDEANREILGRAGLEQHPDLFAPLISSSYRRALWLGINLVTAFIAAWVIGLFEASIEKVVALAVLMPVVASMGGVAGSQTLTLVTRGLALDQVGRNNIWRLVRHELAIASLNGLLWALVVALIAIFWFGDGSLAAVFGIALLIVTLTGALVGSLLPALLKQLGIDPALAGGVVLTTATDAVGFFVFLGLATLWLL
ncbi:magnesium transporter [Marinobacterium arenosum]|uniref:magnesium transporter n=1 Tax=Marinobacterium arenosum TaxID=2862496 RepID=UPI001C94A946|nr:magnesium transporter [Marinobacterium arenosum]MBY4677339.1 magnesium transporter [Marinobacterium arenosum]